MINSQRATVTGTKTLSSEPLALGNNGICGAILTPIGVPDFPPLPDDAVWIQARVDYEGEVEIGNGHAKFTDSGSAFLDYADLGVRDVPSIGLMQFLEVFESNRQVPTPVIR